MKLLVNKTDYIKTIDLAKKLWGEYDETVIFHCYWNGDLNEKHLYSILSCYFFNVYKNKHKIILWIENNIPNKYNDIINEYAEIRQFSFVDEINNTKFIGNKFYYNKKLSFYSDVVRYILLYNYGGIWFDLDCFILRNFNPLFHNFKNEICVYQWEKQNYPNGAIYMSLKPKSEKMKKNIEFIMSYNCGWGFQEANLTYNLPLDMLVLPCSWFDPDWIENPYNSNTTKFFENTNINYNFDNFFKGAFCYHWHNKWNNKIDDNSIIMKLVKIIKDELSKHNIVI